MSKVVKWMKKKKLDSVEFLSQQNPMILKRLAALLPRIHESTVIAPNFPEGLVHSLIRNSHARLLTVGQILQGQDMNTGDIVYRNGTLETRLNVTETLLKQAYNSHENGHHVTVLDGDIHASMAAINVTLNVCQRCVTFHGQFCDHPPTHLIPGLYHMALYMDWLMELFKTGKKKNHPPSCVIVGRANGTEFPAVYEDYDKMEEELRKLGETRQLCRQFRPTMAQAPWTIVSPTSTVASAPAAAPSLVSSLTQNKALTTSQIRKVLSAIEKNLSDVASSNSLAVFHPVLKQNILKISRAVAQREAICIMIDDIRNHAIVVKITERGVKLFDSDIDANDWDKMGAQVLDNLYGLFSSTYSKKKCEVDLMLNYESQDTDYCCAYRAIAAFILLWTGEDPTRFSFKMEGMRAFLDDALCGTRLTKEKAEKMWRLKSTMPEEESCVTIRSKGERSPDGQLIWTTEAIENNDAPSTKRTSGATDTAAVPSDSSPDDMFQAKAAQLVKEIEDVMARQGHPGDSDSDSDDGEAVEIVNYASDRSCSLFR